MPEREARRWTLPLHSFQSNQDLHTVSSPEKTKAKTSAETWLWTLSHITKMLELALGNGEHMQSGVFSYIGEVNMTVDPDHE